MQEGFWGRGGRWGLSEELHGWVPRSLNVGGPRGSVEDKNAGQARPSSWAGWLGSAAWGMETQSCPGCGYCGGL